MHGGKSERAVVDMVTVSSRCVVQRCNQSWAVDRAAVCYRVSNTSRGLLDQSRIAAKQRPSMSTLLRDLANAAITRVDFPAAIYACVLLSGETVRGSLQDHVEVHLPARQERISMNPFVLILSDGTTMIQRSQKQIS